MAPKPPRNPSRSPRRTPRTGAKPASRHRARLWLSIAALAGAGAILVVLLRPAPPPVIAEAPVAAARIAAPKAAAVRPAPDLLAPLIARIEQPAPHPPAALAQPAPPPIAASAPPVHVTARRGGPPLIAIVIDDAGVDRPRTEQAIGLPGPLTFSFMTYAGDLPTLTAAARARGDELMLHVPMEPLARGVDPGPNALLVGQTPDEIRRRLEWGIARAPGIVGANNHEGSRFTAWAPGMAVVLAVLREHGLYFIDSRTSPRTVGAALAQRMGLPHASRDVFLDDDASAPEVSLQLARTEAVARRDGAAIAIGHPHDGTIAALRRWLPTVAARGFQLVPASVVVARESETSGVVAQAAWAAR